MYSYSEFIFNGIVYLRVNNIILFIKVSHSFIQQTFNKHLELVVSDVVGVHLNLQSQQDGKQELVDLIEPSGSVGKCTERQVFDNVMDTFPGDWRLGRFGHGDVEDSQELFQ